MSNGSPKRSRSATARPHKQPSNPGPAHRRSTFKRPCNDELQNITFAEPQTVIAQERLAPAAGAAPSTVPELVSPLTEQEPILQGLEAFNQMQAVKSILSKSYARSAPLQQHENFSSLPAFRKAATEAREASSCSSTAGASKAPVAHLASVTAAFPPLEEQYDEIHSKQVEISKAKKQRFCTAPEMPAILFAAASHLYRTTSTNSSLRISAAAHFMDLLLQASPGRVASWKDICSWAALYGIKSEDLRAAIGLHKIEGSSENPN